MIEAQAVTVRAGRRVLLDNVSFTAQTGAVTGIVGPNGSGKTTLLRALVRAAPLSSGRIVLDGDDLRIRPRRWIARHVAEVGQRSEPDPSLRVVDEVSLGGLAEHGVLRSGGAAFDDRVADALDAVELSHRAFDRLSTLSGGELQRVALARALAQGASHVLLDEPTNHLDIRHRLEIVALLRRIAPTVLIVLHDLDLAAEVCDHVVVLHRGRVAGAGRPAELFRPPLLDAVYDVTTHAHPGPDGRARLSFSLPSPLPLSSSHEKESA
ncbi:ABC transporter ATP-binding protein [Agreia pratensis]|uniref:ABC transporter ATP-binding protein n=1 Tax=Agreia pratensis TaxID=150121 RepID=UPI00188BA7BC|nr:ABC transporter ATP-binding protein [Agreia pratensis]MBF4635853.1 ABC transporter ATP-binding protein [Agreia pratensis]